MRILSLDVSTTTIGYAVFDYEQDGYIKLIHYNYYKPEKEGSIFSRLQKTKEHFTNIINQYNPEELIVEDIIQFMKGQSGAKTIIPLAIFNRTLGLMWYERTNKEPHLMNVLSIRHALKLNKKLPAKEDMPNLVAHHLGIVFPWQMKMNRKTKEPQIMVESYDIADGISVGLAFLKKRSSVPKKAVKKHK